MENLLFCSIKMMEVYEYIQANLKKTMNKLNSGINFIAWENYNIIENFVLNSE